MADHSLRTCQKLWRSPLTDILKIMCLVWLAWHGNKPQVHLLWGCKLLSDAWHLEKQNLPAQLGCKYLCEHSGLFIWCIK